MKTITYTIKDKLGIHARPAGMFVKEVKKFSSEITIEKGGKTINASRLMALMGLGVKCGETVTITINGSDEENAATQIEKFLKENL